MNVWNYDITRKLLWNTNYAFSLLLLADWILFLFKCKSLPPPLPSPRFQYKLKDVLVGDCLSIEVFVTGLKAFIPTLRFHLKGLLDQLQKTEKWQIKKKQLQTVHSMTEDTWNN